MTANARKLIGSLTLGVFAALTTSTGSAQTCDWPDDGTTVEFETNIGNFNVELYPSIAPQTVAKFLEFAAAGYYDGTIFHNAWPNDEQLNPYEVDAGIFTRTGATIEAIDLPATSVPDEACLSNERGALVSVTAATFDGQFGFYVREPGFGGALDNTYTVFGRVVDATGTPIDPLDPLGPLDILSTAVPIDGHLSLDSQFRNVLRMLPFDLERDSTLDDQLALSDLSRCFVDEGFGPTTTLAALNDAATSVNPTEPSLVLYDSGIDQGEMVVTTTQLDNGCGALLEEVSPGVEEPMNFTCPNPTGANEIWRYQRQNRCSYFDFDFENPGAFFSWINCFIFIVLDSEVDHVQTGAQSCLGLAVAEGALEERRSEITTHIPSRVFEIYSVPEPSHALLAFASLVFVARLKRRR
jgi:cyclophilin family peptidyl-prolyl cis-trans isomerase